MWSPSRSTTSRMRSGDWKARSSLFTLDLTEKSPMLPKSPTSPGSEDPFLSDLIWISADVL